MKRIDKYGLEECYKKFKKENPRINYEMSTMEYALRIFCIYCNQEIKTTLRIATIDDKEKLDKALEECLNERGNSIMEFFNLLLEEVEVKE